MTPDSLRPGCGWHRLTDYQRAQLNALLDDLAPVPWAGVAEPLRALIAEVEREAHADLATPPNLAAVSAQPFSAPTSREAEATARELARRALQLGCRLLPGGPDEGRRGRLSDGHRGAARWRSSSMMGS